MKKQQKQPTNRRQLVGIAAGLVLLCIGAFAAFLQYQKSSETRTPLTTDTITTGLIGEYASLVWVAQDQGFFADNGLQVTLKQYPSGPAAIQDLLTGNIDTAMAAEFAAVRNSFNHEDLKILATVSKSQAFFMVARKDHGVERIDDLKGKKVGITSQTVGEFYLGRFLTLNGISAREVAISNMPQADLVKAVTAGTIDAAVLFEPNAYNAKKQLGSTAQQWSIQSGEDIYTQLYGTGKLTTTRPDVIKRYMRALVTAEEYIQSHDAEARAIVARSLDYDEDYISYIWPRFTFELSLSQELLLALDDEARWAMENHLTSAREVPNYLRFIYMDALESVRPEAVSIIR